MSVVLLSVAFAEDAASGFYSSMLIALEIILTAFLFSHYLSLHFKFFTCNCRVEGIHSKAHNFEL